MPRHESDTNRTHADRRVVTEDAADDFEAFREELRNALSHLHDPKYRVSRALYQALGCDPARGLGIVQRAIIQAIAALRPDPGVPVDSYAERNFESLHKRFVLGLSQEETAERLHMSVRHVQRVQAKATHVLARAIWERSLAGEDLAGTLIPRKLSQPTESAETGDESPDWRSQTELELASLRMSEPDATADVGETIRGVLQLGRILASRRGIRLNEGFVQPGLIAALHPTALRQALITAVGHLSQYTISELTFYATLAEGRVKITISGPTAPGSHPQDDELTHDIILPRGMSVEVHPKDDYVFLEITAPSAGERTVLVVEDNPDMVQFYQRCTAGTPYRVIHLARTQGAVDTVEATAPDIVVLDVMLPHTDGWQLLTHLYERPTTRAIPVIVCSVVKEEELALLLGAALFLPKPVHPRRFVAALDQVYRQAGAGETKAPANSAATY